MNTPAVDDVRALTLHEPWASLLGSGVKFIETRSWSTRYRGPVLIHAGVAPVSVRRVGAYEVHRQADGSRMFNHGTGRWHDLASGAVVSVASLVDVVPIVEAGSDTDHELHRTHGARYLCDPGPTFRTERGTRLGGLRLIEVTADDHSYASHVTTTHNGCDLEAQRPYGHFADGRFAWFFDDPRPLREPVDARGRQGLWKPTPELVATSYRMAA